MPELTYRNFEVEIAPAGPSDYRLAVLNSPGGQARSVLALPADLDAFRQRMAVLNDVILEAPSAAGAALARDVGESLFDALFPQEIRNLYDVSRNVTRQAGEGLRLKLRLNAPEIAALPWEFLFDPRSGAFVALSRHTPLVRYVEVAVPDRPLTIEPPLRILGVAASPDGLPILDIDGEIARVTRGLQSLIEAGQAELTWLRPPTWRALQAALQQGPWHVLHFVGHGEFDDATGEGVIVLADDGGQALHLGAGRLADLLADHRTLRLAVLNACEGAVGHAGSVFSSMAATLVRRELPAVVAMQRAIRDDAALEFCAGFYGALANLYPVDAALAEARKAISLAEPNSLEWATPVLHLRAPDGAIFTAESDGDASKTQPDGGGDAQGGGISIGSIGGSATVIGGDARNVAVGQGNVIRDGADHDETGEATESDSADSEPALRKPRRRGWFGRLLGRDTRSTDDARLVIGGNARNVIVGSRNVQVNVGGRNVTVPIFVIAGALVTLLALLLYPRLEPLWNPGQMQGQFNIAVTQFGETDAAGRVRTSADGRTLSTWLYDQLAAVYAETPDVPLADTVEIWHDTRTDTAQNIPLRVIRGATPEEREANARKLAQRIGAHMIVYGYLTEAGEASGLDLEFYLAPKVNDETASIVGPHRLGRPVAIPLPFDADDPIVNVTVAERLRTRTEALFWLTIGLTQEILGRTEDALATFRRAEGELNDWTPDEGRELLDFFIGREELFLGNDEAAEAAFRAAVALNPSYARAHNGIGSVHLLRGQRVPPGEGPAALPELEDAQAAYAEALRLAREQENALVEHLALLGLGQAARVAGQRHYVRGDFDPAASAFDQAQTYLEQALAYFAETSQYRLIAQGYESLGLAHWQQSDILRQQADEAGRLRELQAAQTAFDACIAQAEAGHFDELLRERIVEQSCAQHRRSIDTVLAELAKEAG